MRKPVSKSKRNAKRTPTRAPKNKRPAKRNDSARNAQKPRKPFKSNGLKTQNLETFLASTPETSESVYQETGAAPFDLPTAYGEDKLVLLVRDPWWIFAYWEVTPRRGQEVRDEIQRLGLREQKTVLRVYDVTDAAPQNAHSHFDIELNFMTDNWTIDVGAPDRQWMAELGIRTQDGRFFVLVRSNVVRTPRFGVSQVLDEEWLLPDELYWKIFGLSGGFGGQKSSLDMREILERYLKGIVSSERSSGFGPAKTEQDKRTIAQALTTQRA